MTEHLPTHRSAWRRTDNFTPGAPKLKLVTELLSLHLDPTQVLIKVHAVALNFRDANIAHGRNPWPVIPNGVLGNDAAGEIIALGEKATTFSIGDRVAPVVDTEFIIGRESGRSWLAADEDGVLADYLVFDQNVLVRLPDHLDWVNCSILPCAGTTAWSAIKGLQIGQSVLIQGGRSQYPKRPQYATDYSSRYRWRCHVRIEAGSGLRPQDHPEFIQRHEDQEDTGVFPCDSHLWGQLQKQSHMAPGRP